MFDLAAKEIMMKELSQIAQEVKQSKQILHSQFSSEIKSVDGKYIGKTLGNMDGVTGGYREVLGPNSSLEGGRHPITGVEFERKIVDLPNGEKVEGVFPKFESKFDAQLKPEMYLESDKTQFKECNKQLYEAIEKNPELGNQFTSEQIEQIKDGITMGGAPDGYVWNHDAEAGKMQLVDFDTHQKTGHVGGRAVWGGGNDYR